MDNLPLAGIRILSLEQYIAAPYCTMWLGDLGAEVIKIEHPKTGEPRRNFPPIFEDDEGEKISAGFLAYNRNKKSIPINLKSDKGVKLLKELILHSDIFVENFKSGAMKKLGIDYDSLKEINPRLIYASISGFGKLDNFEGPYSDYPAFDAVLQAMGGLMDQIGMADGPPMLGTAGLIDRVGAIVTGLGILTALYKREKTGKGEYVDIALYDVAVALSEMSIAYYSFTGEIPVRGKDPQYVPLGALKTKDGYVGIIIPGDLMWKRFCNAIGCPGFIDHPKAQNALDRAAYYDELFAPAVDEWMINHTTDEVVEILISNGIPVGKVQNTKDLFSCPQVKARDMLVDIQDPIAGKYKLANSPIRFSSIPDMEEYKTAPRLGEHTKEILHELLHYSDETIRKLKSDGVTNYSE